MRFRKDGKKLLKLLGACIKMGIEIDLSEENINNRVPLVKTDLASWLSGRLASMEGLESGISKKKTDVYGGLAVMDIEIETAAGLARRGDMQATTYVLAQAMRTKDFIYSQLTEAYGGVQEMLSNGIGGDMKIWRDYIVEKFDGGRRQCEFILANKR